MQASKLHLSGVFHDQVDELAPSFKIASAVGDVKNGFRKLIVTLNLAHYYRMRRIGRQMQLGPVREPAPQHIIDLREITKGMPRPHH